MTRQIYLFTTLIIFSLMLLACSEKSQCEAQLEFETRECDLHYDDPAAICEVPGYRCFYNCIAGMSCSERYRYYFEDWELSYQRKRCLVSCNEGFACDGNDADPNILHCDGFVECQDKTDEQGCSYHMCDDGQFVRENVMCDGYAHCADGSDEAGCEDHQ